MLNKYNKQPCFHQNQVNLSKVSIITLTHLGNKNCELGVLLLLLDVELVKSAEMPGPLPPTAFRPAFTVESVDLLGKRSNCCL